MLLRPDKNFHVRKISRLTGVPAGSLHRELKLLADVFRRVKQAKWFRWQFIIFRSSIHIKEFYKVMLNYLFRKPKYPVICDIDGCVIAAKNEKSFVKCLSEVNHSENTYNLLDSTAEGWAFVPKHMLVSPLTFKKQWTKKELISIFNSRKNLSSEAAQYSEKSLSSKRFERIFADIVELLLKDKDKPPVKNLEVF